MLDALFHPKSIAVIGVSTDPSKVGHQVFLNLRSYDHPLYPINPKHKRILGTECYASILDVPEHIDLVIIATPVFTVEALVHECVDKKVKAVIIVTAGFAEQGTQGLHTQERIHSLLAAHHIDLLGPNTLGFINPHNDLNASFAGSHVEKGSIALISQSGAMLSTMFAEFASREVGCSFAASLGNKSSLTELELLDAAAKDPHTKVIALYLESLSQPRRFFEKTKAISKEKPIILLKGGTTSQGQAASLSHTAALATDTTLLKAASKQMGFVMVDTIEQFFELTFFADQLIKNRWSFPQNLMILTNAGGPGVHAADMAETMGIPLATWKKKTKETLARELPTIKANNPMDLLGDATTDEIKLGIELAMEDDGVESLLLILTPQAVTDIPGIAKMLRAQHKSYTKPIVVALMAGELYHEALTLLRETGIVASEYVNEAIELFAWLSQMYRATTVDRSEQLMKQLAAAPAPTAVTPSKKTLTSGELEEVYLLLEQEGFHLPLSAIAVSEQDVKSIGKLDPDRVFPLIAKTANMRLKHKAVVGGVKKNIQSVDDALAAYTSLKKFSNRVLFQEVIEDATEIIIGGKRDSAFGTFIAVGSGGSLTNIIADRSYVFLPASQRELRKCVQATKIYSVLSMRAKEQLIVAIEHFARLLDNHQEIAEMEINPLMITKTAAYVADVKVVLEKPALATTSLTR